MKKITVIGAGLAGCEAALSAVRSGVAVDLIDMKPEKRTPAHKSDLFAELVCSNSLKAARIDSAAGLLKEEMRRLSSVCLAVADGCRVAAGGALAVDRDAFSAGVTERIKNCENINVITETVEKIPDSGVAVVATGPLTDSLLARDIERFCGESNLSFFDAAAPIVTSDSVDMNIAFSASRYGNGENDYINCPMNKAEYEAFYNALINAETAPVHGVDASVKVYEGCMPIEVLAKRGVDSVRFGPMKPVGLRDPRTGHRPWAVVQLRRENASGTLYNLVGFQTNLKFGEQKRVFSMIPGLKDAIENIYTSTPLTYADYTGTEQGSAYGVNKDFNRLAYTLLTPLSPIPNVFFTGQNLSLHGILGVSMTSLFTCAAALKEKPGFGLFGV